MMGFVSAISASLAVFILVAIGQLLSFIYAIIPKQGIVKIDDLHYRYTMKNVYLSDDLLENFSASITEIEGRTGMARESFRPVCNYGFDRAEQEVSEIVTFNYIKLNQFFGDDPKILLTNILPSNGEINYCFIDIQFTTDAGIRSVSQVEPLNEVSNG